MENPEHQSSEEKTVSTHKTRIEQESVQSFLNSHFNNTASNLTPITGGEGSQAFSFEAKGEDLVIRVNKHSDRGFRKDEYASRHFASIDIPIPEVKEIGTLDSGQYFAITKKVEGKLFKTLSDEEFDEALPNLFRTLEAIHSIPVADTVGYGVWNVDGDGEKETWRDVMLNVDQYAKTMFDNTFLEKELWDIVYARFVELLPYCPEDKYLVHADYNFDNVLADKGKISGVIDWENSMYGDFLYDIAWLSFWSKDFDYEEAYLEFSKSIGKEIENFEQRVLCYKLYIGMGSLSFYAYSGQKDKYDLSKEKLLKYI